MPSKEYYEKNKEKVREKQKEWFMKNKDKVKVIQRRYYLKHRKLKPKIELPKIDLIGDNKHRREQIIKLSERYNYSAIGKIVGLSRQRIQQICLKAKNIAKNPIK